MSQMAAVFGPLSSGQVYLLTLFQDQLYVLRPDPNSNFPPYFGELNSQNSGAFLNLQLNSDLSQNPPSYTLLTSDQGFQQDASTGFIQLSTNSGSFNYLYVNSDGSRVNVTSGTPLVASLLTQLVVNSQILKFHSKSLTDEQTDQQNSMNSDYMPTYQSGSIDLVFFIPAQTYPSGNCGTVDTNVAYADVASGQSSGNVSYTNAEWCQNNITYSTHPLCMSSNLCGTSNCYGPCSSSQMCLPDGSTLSCQTPSDNPLGLSTPLLIVIVIVAILLVIGLIVLAYKI